MSSATDGPAAIRAPAPAASTAAGVPLGSAEVVAVRVPLAKVNGPGPIRGYQISAGGRCCRCAPHCRRRQSPG